MHIYPSAAFELSKVWFPQQCCDTSSIKIDLPCSCRISAQKSSVTFSAIGVWDSLKEIETPHQDQCNGHLRLYQSPYYISKCRRCNPYHVAVFSTSIFWYKVLSDHSPSSGTLLKYHLEMAEMERAPQPSFVPPESFSWFFPLEYQFCHQQREREGQLSYRAPSGAMGHWK